MEESEEDWRVVNMWDRALELAVLTECGLGVERNMKQNSRRKQLSRVAGGGGAKGERMSPGIKQDPGAL
jgi:hypothetical protein